jgi:hypothetical protein
VVDNSSSSLAVVIVAVVVIGILALMAALVFANFDVIRGPDSGSQDNPVNPPEVLPENPDNGGILPTQPAPAPSGSLNYYFA